MTVEEQRWFEGGFELGLRMCELAALGIKPSQMDIQEIAQLEAAIQAMDTQISNMHNASIKEC